jgi:hypothetical protein
MGFHVWIRRTLAAIAIVLATTLPAHAALVHQYKFNGNLCDSVGAAHAALVDGGEPSAVFTASGKLDLSANVGQLSNAANLTDAYVDLPNGIIQNAARSGVSGALTLEWWFTISTPRTWARLGDFAGPLAGGGSEGVTDNGAVNFLAVTPNSGRVSNGPDLWNHVADGPDETLGSNMTLPVGVQHNLIAVYDKTNTLGGANPGGTMTMYLNGTPIVPGDADVFGTGAISEAFDLNNLNDEDNWLGRSQWPDPMFDGLINEFRIYDHALSAAEVADRFRNGPDVPQLPTLIVNTLTGTAAIHNLASFPVALDAYEIVSPAGRLDADAWDSLSDQELDAGLAADFNRDGEVDGADLALWADAQTNADDCPCTPSPFPGDPGDANFDAEIDGRDFLVWQQQVGEPPGGGISWDEVLAIGDNLLAERFLSGATTLEPGEQVALGAPFRVGGAKDLAFRFSLAGEPGSVVGLVQYVTTGPATPVPEPTTLVTLAAAALLVWHRRQRDAL